MAKNAHNVAEDLAVARSVVDKARLTLTRLKAAGDAPAPTDQELGMDFGRLSGHPPVRRCRVLRANSRVIRPLKENQYFRTAGYKY